MALSEAEELELLELEEEEYQSGQKAPETNSELPKSSMFESGLRGLAQGGSLGFADEITGGLESLFSDKTYEQARDESRANYSQAKEANPLTYGAGELGGNVATAFVPGLNIAKGASLAKMAGQAALQGGLMGAGHSEADNLGDLAIDTGAGAALGGVTAGTLGKALPKMGSFVDRGIEEIATNPYMGKAIEEPIRSGIKTASKGLATGAIGYGGATGDWLNSGAAMLASKGADAAADVVAPLASKTLDKISQQLMKSPKMAELYGKNPQVFNMIAQKMAPQVESKQESKPFQKNDLLQATQGTKYSQVLQDAAKRGEQAMAASHFVLQSTDPEYRKLFNEGETDGSAAN